MRGIARILFWPDLEVLERADHLMRRKGIYEKLHPDTRAGGDRKSETFKSKDNNYPLKTPSFVEDTAKKAKLSESTVKQEVQIARNIAPKAKEQDILFVRGEKLDVTLLRLNRYLFMLRLNIILLV